MNFSKLLKWAGLGVAAFLIPAVAVGEPVQRSTTPPMLAATTSVKTGKTAKKAHAKKKKAAKKKHKSGKSTKKAASKKGTSKKSAAKKSHTKKAAAKKEAN